MAWFEVVNDLFNRPDGVPGVAGSTTGVGNGWIDVNGGEWAVINNKCQSTAGTAFMNYLVRPSSEAAQDQRITTIFDPASVQQMALLRVNGQNAYYCAFPPTGAITVSFLPANTIVFTGNWTPVAGKTYLIDFSAEGASPTTLTVKVFDITNGANTEVFSQTGTNSAAGLQTAGSYGVTHFQTAYYDQITTYNTVAPTTTPATTYTITGATTAVNGLPISLTVALPTDTAVPSPVNVTLAASGVAGAFSSNTVSLTTATPSQTITFTPSATGNLVISGTNNGGLTNPSNYTVTVAAPTANSLTPGQANLFLSPYNWLVAGGVATSNTPGAYLKAKFTGSTSLNLGVNTSNLTGQPAGAYPFVRWSLNNGAFQTQQLTAGQTTLSLGAGLTTGTTYNLELYFFKSGDYTVDKWGTSPPPNALRVTGLTLSAGGSFSAPTLRPKRVIIYGDSITEGLFTLGVSLHSSTDAYTYFLGVALNAEYGAVGFGSQGWANAGAGGVPMFTSAWNLFFFSQPRSFTVAPDIVVVNHGTNDGFLNTADSTVTSSVQSWLGAARTAFGTNTQICIVIPFGGFKRAAITSAFNAYQAANASDTKLKLVDLGVEAQKGLDNTIGANAYSADGLHPILFASARLAAMVATAIPNTLQVNAIVNSLKTLSSRVKRFR